MPTKKEIWDKLVELDEEPVGDIEKYLKKELEKFLEKAEGNQNDDADVADDTAPEEPEEAPIPEKKCGFCGQIIKSTDKNCPICGWPN